MIGISRVKPPAEPMVCGLSPGGSEIRTLGPWRTRSAVSHIETNCVGSVETRCRGFSAPARRPAFRGLTKRPYRQVSLTQLQRD
jgi:hypothetical protein